MEINASISSEVVFSTSFTDWRYKRKADDYIVAPGVRFHSDEWDLTKKINRPSAFNSRKRISLENFIPESLKITKERRSHLWLVARDYCDWAANTAKLPWMTAIQYTKQFFSRLAKLMLNAGYSNICDISYDDLKCFATDLNYSESYLASLQKFLQDLHELACAGKAADGPSCIVDPRACAKALQAVSRLTKARPLDDKVYLPALKSAIEFVSRWRSELVDILKSGDREKIQSELSRVGAEYRVKGGSTWRLVMHFQAACFLMISSTLVGRLNEFSDLLVGCSSLEEIEEELAYVVYLVASKKRKQRVPEASLGIELTFDAIAALEEITAAYPLTSRSTFLFTKMHLKSTEKVRPLYSGAMLGWVRRFLADVTGLSKETCDAFTLHQLRTTTLTKVCQEPRGIMTALRLGRFEGKGQLHRYVGPDATKDVISARLKEAA
jgi:hypothetical protein